MFSARQFVPFAKKIGTPKFWRKIVEWMPVRRIQQARSIIDLMQETSVEIYSKKLEALKQGDEAVMEQIGSGNDIMSILRAYFDFNKLHTNIWFIYFVCGDI